MNAPDEPSLRPEWDLQLSRILHEIAGAVSMCWNSRPSGEFESTQAAQFVADAIAEIRSLAQAQEPPALTPDEPSRKQGHSKLVYDKERRTIVAVDPSPALAPDRAKLVKEIDAFMADAPKGHPHTRYRYGELLQRARDMIVADAAATKAPLPEDVQSHAEWLRQWEQVCIRAAQNNAGLLHARITELEAKCSALEADKRRLDKLEAIITTGWYLDSWSGRPGCAFFTGCDDPPKFSAETVRGALDSALASQPPEGKA